MPQAAPRNVWRKSWNNCLTTFARLNRRNRSSWTEPKICSHLSGSSVITTIRTTMRTSKKKSRNSNNSYPRRRRNLPKNRLNCCSCLRRALNLQTTNFWKSWHRKIPRSFCSRHKKSPWSALLSSSNSRLNDSHPRKRSLSFDHTLITPTFEHGKDMVPSHSETNLKLCASPENTHRSSSDSGIFADASGSLGAAFRSALSFWKASNIYAITWYFPPSRSA